MLRLLLFFLVLVPVLRAQTTIKPLWQQTHLQHVGFDAFLSADGSSIITQHGFGFSIWDAKSGIHKHNVSSYSSAISRYGQYCISDSLVAFSGERSEFASYDSVEVWNYQTAKYLYSFHFTGTAYLVFDKAGKYLAVAMDKKIEIREAQSGIIIRTLFPDDEYSPFLLSFNSDASMIMCDEGVGSYWGTVRLWNMEDGVLVNKVNGQLPDSSDFPLKFSEKENILAYHNKKKKSIVFRDVYTNNQSGEIPTEGTIVALGVPKKNNCITQERDASIVLWDIQTGKSLFSFHGLNGQTSRIRFNRDTTLLIATDGQTICVCDINSGEMIKKISFIVGEYVNNCSLLTGTDILITRNNRTYVLDWSQNKVKNIFLPIDSYGATCNEIAGEVLTISSQTVVKRKLSTGELTEELKTDRIFPDEEFSGLSHSGKYVHKMEYIGDSVYFTYVNTESKINVLRISTSKTIGFKIVTSNKYLSKIAVATGDNVISIYDTLGTKLQSMDNGFFNISAMFFDSKGDILFTQSRDTIKIWDVNKGDVLHRFPSSRVLGSFNEKLGKFVTASDARIYVWDVHTGALLKTIDNNRKNFYLLYHPSDDNIMVFDTEKYIGDVIDVENGKTIFTIRDTTVFFANYDPQGKFIYLNSFEKNPQLFDAKNGKYLTDLVGLNGEGVGWLNFSDGGRYVMAGVARDKFAIWDLKDIKITSAFNNDTPYGIEKNLLFFHISENELRIIINEILNHPQKFTIYNVCGEKMHSGILPSFSNEFTLPLITLRNGVYYFESIINDKRVVHQFVVLR